MKMHPFRFGVGLALALTAVAAGAADLPTSVGPRQNLWVEVRWVDSAVSGAAMAAIRDGSVVVGTAGSVSSRGSVGFNTQRRDEQQVQRLLVLNGDQASVQLTETTPVQWLDFGVQFDAAAGGAGGAGGATPLPAAGGANSNVNRGWAVPRQGVTEQTQGFTVTPHWPGGQQPVRVELRAQGSSGSGNLLQGQSQAQTQAQVLSTVSVGLGQWLTVARSGAATQRQERGVISSRSAETQRTRELQLRVDLAP
ncbi:hypothetical protein LNV09_18225 [Paucibacter sp. B2R-40]|uniref:hypothetical protein n=1 Tax=Paucibacter sp. B2R-40 TaxID=2893554 RepID=UPI0021E35C94|nr:hypothetical protein [Paucibacter sp. B2R-40]MCV2356083.1 hypothetical protein [Paucibacter sp. B2R-40]